MMMVTKLCMDSAQSEIIRVENCLKWHPMSTVSIDIPRTVHADDVKNLRVHVAGRGMHFVYVRNKCGIGCTLSRN